jgi:hypothetical protein
MMKNTILTEESNINVKFSLGYQVGLNLNMIHQLLAYANDVNLLGT